MSRSSLLDAQSLQSEIVQHLHSQITEAFKYFPLQNSAVSNFFAKSQPEIRALLEAGFLYATLSTSRATLGQKELGIQLQNLTKFRTVALIGLKVILPYLDQRRNLFPLFSAGSRQDRFIEQCSTCLKAASIVNLLIFLQEGIYPNLSSRILGLKPQMLPGARQVSDEIMARELLWSAFIEFLISVIPLINLRKVRGLFHKLLESSFGRESSSSSPPSSISMDECTFCHRTPIIPSVNACSHVFCYYCLGGNLKADPDFKCPSCKTTLTESNIRMLRL